MRARSQHAPRKRQRLRGSAYFPRAPVLHGAYTGRTKLTRLEPTMTRMRSRKWLLAVTAALSLNAVLWLASPGLSLPRALENYFLGPKMVRAEIVLKSGDVLHDYRIDAGRIRSVSSST